MQLMIAVTSFVAIISIGSLTLIAFINGMAQEKTLTLNTNWTFTLSSIAGLCLIILSAIAFVENQKQNRPK